MKSNLTGTGNGCFWAALIATNRNENNTRMRPTHERSRLCGCVSIICFHLLQCLFLFSTNQRLDEFVALALSVLTSSVLLFSTALRVLYCIFVMLGLQDEGSSKENLYGLCFPPFHQHSIVTRDPHIFETYQSVGRIEAARQQAENRCFR